MEEVNVVKQDFQKGSKGKNAQIAKKCLALETVAQSTQWNRR